MAKKPSSQIDADSPSSSRREDTLLRIIDILVFVLVVVLIVLLTYGYVYMPWPLRGLDDKHKAFVDGLIINILSTCAVFLVSYYIFRIVQNVRFQMQSHDLADEIRSEFVRYYEIIGAMKDAGIVGCFQNFESIKFQERIRRAHHVHIMTTWMEAPFAFGPAFSVLATVPHHSVKVLLLNPESRSAWQRGQDIARPEVPDLIRMNVQALKAFKRTYALKLEVRYYDSLPSIMLYICDSDAFFAIFPHGDIAEFGPTFHATLRNPSNGATGHCSVLLNREFQEVWDKATVVDLDS